MERHLWHVQEFVRQGQLSLSDKTPEGDIISFRNSMLETVAGELGLNAGEILNLSGTEVVSERSYQLAQLFATYFEPFQWPN
jgi:hypothetical protein